MRGVPPRFIFRFNFCFLHAAKMAGLPLPSPTHSEVSESALSSEDTIRSSGRKKKKKLNKNKKK